MGNEKIANIKWHAYRRSCDDMKTTKVPDKIKPCPKTPNCVSSVDTDPRHFVHPLQFEGSVNSAHSKMMHILNKLKRVRIVKLDKDFIEAEFKSSGFGFVDDVQFHFDDRMKIIHLRSASRLGYSDLGVNRKRLERVKVPFLKIDV